MRLQIYWMLLKLVQNYPIEKKSFMKKLKNEIKQYYSNWRNFFFDDTFALLRRIYFSVNNKNDIFAEEVFVEYMRILDGYHTRISGDEETKIKLKKCKINRSILL